VTGIGVVTPLGLDWHSNFEAFREAPSAIRTPTLFDVSKQRAKVAAEIGLPALSPAPGLSRRRLSRWDRASKILLMAAREAWDQSGWERSDALPIVLGSTSGGMSLGQAFLRQATEQPGRSRDQAARSIHYLCQHQALDLCEALGIRGPITLIGNACASGANALGHAWSLIRSGKAERVIAGGYDALSHMVFAGFDSLQALSTTQCRPFDADRDGLALGEGAAVFALERLDQAERRGGVVLSELAGYGAATDIHHLTQPHPEGRAAEAAMRSACDHAGIGPESVDYVNAHGTGTALNDAAETAAINRWAGDRAGRIAVSSIKGSVGHSLGAAGAIEAAVCIMAIQGGYIPPTTSLTRPEPSARFELISRPEQRRLDCALTNSFGFGGANASLIFRRPS
jgi:3-oxoacyl-[acyl-carrier-protein] synthase II